MRSQLPLYILLTAAIASSWVTAYANRKQHKIIHSYEIMVDELINHTDQEIDLLNRCNAILHREQSL
jgi:hypothetical protein